jgi:NAD(P)-dependent dehydrogenase (short-subunit alcohol dehydrogenase family)
LVLTGRNEAALAQTIELCSPASRANAFTFAGDLSSVDVCEKVVATAIEKFGRIDILVNSAGILLPGSIETMKMDDYDTTMNINVKALIHLTQSCLSHLIQSKGAVVNVSSVTGTRSFPGVLSYCMSKAAVDQFTKCVALELAPKGVRVNSVNPGVIVTDLHKRSGQSEEQYAKFLKHCEETHALGRPGYTNEGKRFC